MGDYTLFPAVDDVTFLPPAQVRTALAESTEFKNLFAAKTALGAKADLVDGKIPSSQLPSLAISESYPVANRAAMLALSATQVQKGDIAVITADPDKGSYILTADDPSVFGNWLLLNSPTDVVVSVNGKNGVVTLAKGDVGLGNVNNTSDADKPISTAVQAALDNKASFIENVFTASSATSIQLAEPSQFGVNVITLQGAGVAISFPPLPADGKSKTLLVVIKQDATGARTASWPATVKWPGGYTPVLSVNANKADVISFSSYDGLSWYGFPGGLGF
jgi:hypothetical protein